MDVRKTAELILEHIGGKENIANVTHCATRLRINPVDFDKINVEAIEGMDGIISVINKGNQFQVVIGGKVSKVYKEIVEIGKFDNKTSKAKSVKEEEDENKSVWAKILDTISGSFAPIIPPIIAAGMGKAVLSILLLLKWVSPESQTYAILNVITDGVFYFLPIFLAYSAAIKFKCNPFMAMSFAAILVHPTITDMFWAHEPVTFFGIPMVLANYTSSVIPILLTVWFMSHVYRFTEKISPTIFSFFLPPMLTLMIVAPISLLVIGPLGIIAGNYLMVVIQFLSKNLGWFLPVLIGAFQPFIVMTGMHYSIFPLVFIALGQVGYDTALLPAFLVSNLAQGAATLAVAMRTKDKNMKQIAITAGTTALCGITEPSLYGVNMKLKRPLYASLIGGGFGGLYAGITGVKCFAFGSMGLTGLPLFVGNEGTGNITNTIIASAIGMTVSFGITYVWGIKEDKKSLKTA